jgi:hypothetical protein
VGHSIHDCCRRSGELSAAGVPADPHSSRAHRAAGHRPAKSGSARSPRDVSVAWGFCVHGSRTLPHWHGLLVAAVSTRYRLLAGSQCQEETLVQCRDQRRAHRFYSPHTPHSLPWHVSLTQLGTFERADARSSSCLQPAHTIALQVRPAGSPVMEWYHLLICRGHLYSAPTNQPSNPPWIDCQFPTFRGLGRRQIWRGAGTWRWRCAWCGDQLP